jgi:hypothetical protein
MGKERAKAEHAMRFFMNLLRLLILMTLYRREPNASRTGYCLQHNVDGYVAFELFEICTQQPQLKLVG